MLISIVGNCENTFSSETIFYINKTKILCVKFNGLCVYFIIDLR